MSNERQTTQIRREWDLVPFALIESGSATSRVCELK